jgi:hypothetical protein
MAMRTNAAGISGWCAVLDAVGDKERAALEKAYAKLEAREIKAMAPRRGAKATAAAKRL